MERRRIGLIGFGHVGQHVYREIRARPELGLEIAFVHNRSREKLSDVPEAFVLGRLEDLADRQADLVVEMAHPDISRLYGETILDHADYMVLSTTALADAALHERLIDRALKRGRRLFLSHGALVGVQELEEARDNWVHVEITFEKNPRNIDFDASGIDGGALVERTIVFEGTARGIAKLFPRNVNSMMTLALATVGPDACRARLVADPALDAAIARIAAVGKDGTRFEIMRTDPIVGVTSVGVLASQVASICRTGGFPHGLNFV